MINAKIFVLSDIKDRVEWINNSAINSTMYFELPANIEKTIQWFNKKDNSKRADFTFFDNNSERIAMGGITNYDCKNSKAEFYIMVSPAYHGCGYGTKISKWLFNYAFMKYPINKLYLLTDDDNPNASKIYEKAGFQLEGILRKHSKKNNEFKDRRFYGLLRDEWEKAEWKQLIITNEFH
ncbi:MAG: GNAT family N-acetyltransferase [Cyclobacteriaceae bacterium]